MRVVVTGGRDYAESATVYATLDSLGVTALAHGCASGADSLAWDWARKRGAVMRLYPADWEIGPRAGPLRNQHMLTDFKPDLVVAFPGGKGTADCVRRAKRLGIPVHHAGRVPEGER